MTLFDREQEGERSISAESMVEALLAGRSMTAHQHFVIYDRDEGLVWCTNPYGIDLIVCKHPTVERMRCFLNGLEAGRCYGLVPD